MPFFSHIDFGASADFKGQTALILAVSGLLCVCLTGCAEIDNHASATLRSTTGAPNTTHETPAFPSSTDQYRRGDADVDDYHGIDGPGSEDDYPLTQYGHLASARDARKIATLVKHYYSFAVQRNGVMACSLLYDPLARDPALIKTVPEDRYSRPARPRVLPGETCAEVTSLLFNRRHETLTTNAATVEVTHVRVKGSHGVAVLSFKTAPEQWLPVVREGTVWKLHALLPVVLP
jgi:hypothetical protein